MGQVCKIKTIGIRGINQNQGAASLSAFSWSCIAVPINLIKIIKNSLLGCFWNKKSEKLYNESDFYFRI